MKERSETSGAGGLQPMEIEMENKQDVKVVDYSNGWSSEPMTDAQAQRYIETHPAPTSRGVEPAEAEWCYDHRFGEWAWFSGGKRIS